MCRRKVAAVAVFLLFATVLCVSTAVAERVSKSRLDPMNYQYEGMEISGDDFADAIMIDIISSKKTFFIGDAGGGLSRFGVNRLSDEERAALPDMVTEADLNGDKINDLIVVNLEKLTKAASRDDRTFMRVLEYSVYFGQDANSFKTLRFSLLEEDDRKIIEQNAKALLLAPTEVSDSTSP